LENKPGGGQRPRQRVTQSNQQIQDILCWLELELEARSEKAPPFFTNNEIHQSPWSQQPKQQQKAQRPSCPQGLIAISSFLLLGVYLGIKELESKKKKGWGWWGISAEERIPLANPLN
jgi:hypothetical protein